MDDEFRADFVRDDLSGGAVEFRLHDRRSQTVGAGRLT